MMLTVVGLRTRFHQLKHKGESFARQLFAKTITGVEIIVNLKKLQPSFAKTR